MLYHDHNLLALYVRPKRMRSDFPSAVICSLPPQPGSGSTFIGVPLPASEGSAALDFLVVFVIQWDRLLCVRFTGFEDDDGAVSVVASGAEDDDVDVGDGVVDVVDCEKGGRARPRLQSHW